MGKSKYEVAKEILDHFRIGQAAFRKFQNQNLSESELTEKALEWYLEQYKKVLKAMDESEK